jgi:hypothetical protein
MSNGWDIYKKLPGFVFGFHGCDESVGEAVLQGKQSLSPSENDYDWLGSGIYFWEGNPERALKFAEEAVNRKPKTTKGKIRKPFVIGAVVDLGYCFNLMDSSSLAELKSAHLALSSAWQITGTKPPVNTGGPDKGARYLDRAVIEAMHKIRSDTNLAPYETVRSAFWEGEELYSGAGFSENAHIQIAVRNVECIRGYFRPISK